VLDIEFESICWCLLIDSVMEGLTCSAWILGHPSIHEEGNEKEGLMTFQGVYYSTGVCKGEDLHALHVGVEDGF